ncbi:MULTISPECIES: hypothetical protein [unclassified Sphingopyxis]|uniref:hypothetical protein n=1 Tax=unclassified Sphingopyxis TaxID=2614943 RepID=UPI000736E72C|nr:MULTISPECIES: hypothetical protein [unclassified Sphingopyxis]KTE23575.1 hypothetical protein ATE61_16645 [Sphingopyxis sp. H057]KTE53168.1 hypothetical protein ATE69_12630 [Sphingopyxis sp. H071]KTE63509.1 hypothetical protein ATE65_15200 [Sphingopyxis sp. H100]KTE71629.1 hypothetical protein ATE60_13480 [Sphingopyxis sp. H081]
MKKAGLGLLAGIAIMGGADRAEAKWLRADTDNFIIYSEGSEKSLRDFADKLERFDATLSLRFGISRVKEPNRLTIYLVERAADAGRLTAGRLGPSIAGFYSADPEGSFAVSNRESTVIKGTPEWQQTLFHEYGHHFMRRYLHAAFPAWFIEGFAEYYSTTDFTKDGKAEIGKPPYGRAYGLLEMPKIPAETLLFQRPGTMRNSGQMDVYYGRAWLLTHMLYSSTTRSGQLGAYLGAINKGVEAKKAATDAFGDLAQLDRDLNTYLKQRLSYRTTGEPIAVSATVTITPLSPADDAMLPLQLERKSASGNEERLVKVRDSLTKLAAQHAGDADVWYELAMAEWDRGKEKRDPAAARASVDKALALDPRHVRANVLLGRIMLDALREKDDPSAADWNAARKPIILANQTNPDDPVPLLAYFQSFAPQGHEPPSIAIDGLARAFELAPENGEARINYAFALANRGKFDRAIALAKSIAYDPHGNGDGPALLDRLEAMKAKSEGKAAADDESAD